MLARRLRRLVPTYRVSAEEEVPGDIWQTTAFYGRPDLPGKHDTLTQCWANVGQPSTTVS